MKKPSTLDSVTMSGLNTCISCHGAEFAVSAYRKNCARVGLEPDSWAIRYLELYAKYFKKDDGYIDIKAAERALSEA